MKFCYLNMLMVVFCFALFSSCATDKKKPSPIVTKVSQVRKNLSNLATSYGQKDEKGFLEEFDTTSEAFSLLRARILKDFEHFSSSELSFVVDHVEVEAGRIKTVVRWKGRWTQKTSALPLEKRGKAIFFWNDTSDPKMVEVRGDSPFATFR